MFTRGPDFVRVPFTRPGTASFDNIAGSIGDMFKFSQPSDSALLLNQKTGEVLS